jgi:nucleoside-diphosphate-sugar epimerase
VEKARERLDWEASVDLRQGLGDTVAWLREQGAASRET